MAAGGEGPGGAAGNGGQGGAGTESRGQDGDEECSEESGSNSGGGGGSVGRIRINTLSASVSTTGNTVFSPTDDLGDCTGLCNQAEVSLW
jgi:hypothetical protein